MEKVSALMLTYLPIRFELAKRSIDCFLSQTYENKELIIINTGGNAYFKQLDDYINSIEVNNIKHIYINRSNKTLGDLRNISVKNATGEYLCTWVDDDFFLRQRLQFQAHFMKHLNLDMCMFSNFVLQVNDKKYAVSYGRGFEPSLMFKKCELHYPSVNKHEDVIFIDNLCKAGKKGFVIDNDCNDYFYNFVGTNVSKYGHFMNILKNHKNKKL